MAAAFLPDGRHFLYMAANLLGEHGRSRELDPRRLARLGRPDKALVAGIALERVGRRRITCSTSSERALCRREASIAAGAAT